MCLVPDTRLRAVRRLNGYYPDQPRGQVTDVAIDDAEQRDDRGWLLNRFHIGIILAGR